MMKHHELVQNSPGKKNPDLLQCPPPSGGSASSGWYTSNTLILYFIEPNPQSHNRLDEKLKSSTGSIWTSNVGLESALSPQGLTVELGSNTAALQHLAWMISRDIIIVDQNGAKIIWNVIKVDQNGKYNMGRPYISSERGSLGNHLRPLLTLYASTQRSFCWEDLATSLFKFHLSAVRFHEPRSIRPAGRPANLPLGEINTCSSIGLLSTYQNS